jgi:hypothetical protein
MCSVVPGGLGWWYMAAAHADGHKRRRKAPQKHTSENGLGKLTLLAEDVPPLACSALLSAIPKVPTKSSRSCT